MQFEVTYWRDGTVSEERIADEFRRQGLHPVRWSNGPGDRYGAHTHDYHKVLYCVSGSITFDVEGESVLLNAGDRLDLPAGRSTPRSSDPKVCSVWRLGPSEG